MAQRVPNVNQSKSTKNVKGPSAKAAAPAQKFEEPALRAAPAEAAAVLAQPAVPAPVKPRGERPLPTPETQGAIEMNETMQKTSETMQKTQDAAKQVAEKGAEQFRGAMDQANERGQVAMEKGARLVEEMADLTRGNLEAMVASQKTAAKYVETMTQGAADYSRRSFEEASATLKSFAEVKSPTDFFRLQSEYARSAFDQFVAEGSRVTETVVKMANDVAEPIASRYAVAAERVKSVAA